VPEVTYALRVNGSPVTPELLGAVIQVDVEDHAELADMLRMRIAVAVRANGSGWTVLDDNLFPRLTPVAVDVIIGGTKTPLFDGFVIETQAAFSNEPGQSLLTVVAMDPTVLMHLEEKVKAWPNMADSDVASAIFSDAAYNLTPVIEATPWQRQEDEQTLIQRGSDIQFLRRLADRNGFECFVELNDSTGQAEGHFHPPKPSATPQGVLSVNLGEATNVNVFSARFDMLGPTTAEVTGLDISSGNDQQSTITSTSLQDLGKSASLPQDRPRKVLLAGTGMAQTGELQPLAQSVVDRSSWAIRAAGELNTLAYGGILRAKRPVEVRGAGRQFSGTYYIERVLHSFSGDGYTQRFELKRNALGLTGSEQFTENGALSAA
jgi:phage protein D